MSQTKWIVAAVAVVVLAVGAWYFLGGSPQPAAPDATPAAAAPAADAPAAPEPAPAAPAAGNAAPSN